MAPQRFRWNLTSSSVRLCLVGAAGLEPTLTVMSEESAPQSARVGGASKNCHGVLQHSVYPAFGRQLYQFAHAPIFYGTVLHLDQGLYTMVLPPFGTVKYGYGFLPYLKVIPTLHGVYPKEIYKALPCILTTLYHIKTYSPKTAATNPPPYTSTMMWPSDYYRQDMFLHADSLQTGVEPVLLLSAPAPFRIGIEPVDFECLPFTLLRVLRDMTPVNGAG